LVEHYWPLVAHTAHRLLARLADRANLDDLVSAGGLGLLHAVQDYRPERRVKFETYCVWRIRGAMLDELRLIDQVSRLTRQRARRLSEATRAFQDRHGRPPSDKELGEMLELSPSKIALVRRVATAAKCRSLSCSSADDSDQDASEGVADPVAADPGNAMMIADLKQAMRQVLAPQDRTILLLHYCEQMTQNQIGQVLHLSESRVCQEIGRALTKLRARLDGSGRARLTA